MMTSLDVFFVIVISFLYPIDDNKCVGRYTAPDFLYVRSWLPCIFFSGGITMGNIGRQLALVSRKLYSYNSRVADVFMTSSLYSFQFCVFVNVQISC